MEQVSKVERNHRSKRELRRFGATIVATSITVGAVVGLKVAQYNEQRVSHSRSTTQYFVPENVSQKHQIVQLGNSESINKRTDKPTPEAEAKNFKDVLNNLYEEYRLPPVSVEVNVYEPPQLDHTKEGIACISNDTLDRIAQEKQKPGTFTSLVLPRGTSRCNPNDHAVGFVKTLPGVSSKHSSSQNGKYAVFERMGRMNVPPGIIYHEMGHLVFGLMHMSRMEGDKGTDIKNAKPILKNDGSVNEYGGNASIMGDTPVGNVKREMFTDGEKYKFDARLVNIETVEHKKGEITEYELTNNKNDLNAIRIPIPHPEKHPINNIRKAGDLVSHIWVGLMGRDNALGVITVTAQNDNLGSDVVDIGNEGLRDQNMIISTDRSNTIYTDEQLGVSIKATRAGETVKIIVTDYDR